VGGGSRRVAGSGADSLPAVRLSELLVPRGKIRGGGRRHAVPGRGDGFTATRPSQLVMSAGLCAAAILPAQSPSRERLECLSRTRASRIHVAPSAWPYRRKVSIYLLQRRAQ
jgi:hypothetical protein